MNQQQQRQHQQQQQQQHLQQQQQQQTCNFPMQQGPPGKPAPLPSYCTPTQPANFNIDSYPNYDCYNGYPVFFPPHSIRSDLHYSYPLNNEYPQNSMYPFYPYGIYPTASSTMQSDQYLNPTPVALYPFACPTPAPLSFPSVLPTVNNNTYVGLDANNNEKKLKNDINVVSTELSDTPSLYSSNSTGSYERENNNINNNMPKNIDTNDMTTQHTDLSNLQKSNLESSTSSCISNEGTNTNLIMNKGNSNIPQYNHTIGFNNNSNNVNNNVNNHVAMHTFEPTNLQHYNSQMNYNNNMNVPKLPNDVNYGIYDTNLKRIQQPISYYYNDAQDNTYVERNRHYNDGKNFSYFNKNGAMKKFRTKINPYKEKNFTDKFDESAFPRGSKNYLKNKIHLHPSRLNGAFTPEAIKMSLENPRHTTNVYIRGLLPHFNDQLLYQITSRFGRVRTAKAMIDIKTGMCKGIGFADFEKEQDAVACIINLLINGYQASFAKQSFTLRLKNLRDPMSTNLYFSNLPVDFDELKLEELISPHKAISLRILRDSSSNSRGVGFARMLDRNAADKVISLLNGRFLEGAKAPVQIRFSDTSAQKQFKLQSSNKKKKHVQDTNPFSSSSTKPGSITQGTKKKEKKSAKNAQEDSKKISIFELKTNGQTSANCSHSSGSLSSMFSDNSINLQSYESPTIKVQPELLLTDET